MPVSVAKISPRLTQWCIVALVFVLAFICYWPALNGEFLWDDDNYVTPEGLRSWRGLWLIWTEVLATQQYYPVLHTAFWIEHRLWGDWTLPYHVTNVLQHTAAGCVLALFLRRLWSLPRPAYAAPHAPETGVNIPAGTEWIAAILFVVHPVCVESVAWISEQKNTLSLFFHVLAAYTYLGFVKRRSAGLYGIATTFFILALGGKIVAATLPPALLVALWWKNGTLNWKRDVVPLLPWFVLGAASGLAIAWVEKYVIGAEGTEFEFSLIERTLLASRIVWFYLSTLFWPVDLAMFNERWDVATQAAGWIGYLLAAVVLTVALWAIRKKSRGPLAAWLLFVGSLFPELGFFNIYFFRFSFVADHFHYLAMPGVLTGIAVVACCFLARQPARLRVTGYGAIGLVVVALTLGSRKHSAHFTDDETLFRANVTTVPDNWMAQMSLASAIARTPGREAEALPHAEKAVELNPLSPNAHQRLGELLKSTPGRQHEALAHFERAIELRPNFAEAHYQVALQIASDPKRRDEAIQHLELALETKPLMAEAHHQLANLLVQVPKRFAEGMAHYEQAIYLKPDLAGAHFDFANTLARLPGKLPDAITHYGKTLELRPNFAGGHYRMAVALASIPGQTENAIAHFKAALQIRPDFVAAHYELALLLAEMPDRQTEALHHAIEAVRLDSQNVETYNLVAAIHAQLGSFSEAKSYWEKALQLDPNYETASENLRLLKEMETN